jgi:hypothetical protein
METSFSSKASNGGRGNTMYVNMKRMEEEVKSAPAVLTEKQKEEIMKFRTLVAARLEVVSKLGWKRRMYDVIVSSQGSDEYKSVVCLEFFESELVGPLHLRSSQVALIMQYFQVRDSLIG